MIVPTDLVAAVVQQLGGSDCERIGGGLVAQPVNAVTAGAFVVVGIAVALAAGRMAVRRAESLAFAAAVAAIGVGSVAFHGPQPGGSQLLHDLPILITALFVLDHDLVLTTPARYSRRIALGVAPVLVAAPAIVLPEAMQQLSVAALVGAAVAEVIIARRALRPGRDATRRRITAAIVVVGAIAGGSWVFGRTGSSACDPDSVLQLHGLWHVASATVLGLWWALALGLDRRDGSDRT